MYLAQFNISKMKMALDDPAMKDFNESLDPVNHLADRSEGFVWRLHDESGNATAIPVFDDDTMIFNLSVWESVETLQRFAYASRHLGVLSRRREWFEKISDHSMVLWWVPEDHRPTVKEAESKLRFLRAHGETPEAFSFKHAYDESGERA